MIQSCLLPPLTIRNELPTPMCESLLFFALLLEDQDDFFFMLKIQNYVPLAVNLSIWKQEVYITGTSTTEW